MENVPIPKAPKGASESRRFTPLTVVILTLCVLAMSGWLVSLILIRSAEYPIAFSTAILAFAAVLILHAFGVREQHHHPGMPKTPAELAAFITKTMDERGDTEKSRY